MIDRERIATVPAPHYVCRQFSSYDRDTVGVDKPGWFANWDRSQFVRVEENDGRKEYVMLDADGTPKATKFVSCYRVLEHIELDAIQRSVPDHLLGIMLLTIPVQAADVVVAQQLVPDAGDGKRQGFQGEGEPFAQPLRAAAL